MINLIRRKPLGMMLLAYLWIQPSQSASYADLRAACNVDDSSSLSHAIKRLTRAGYVENFASENDTRARELRLLKPGRDAVGQLLHAVLALKALGQDSGQ
jgi:DNA-binding MarR family transcriptional regulator